MYLTNVGESWFGGTQGSSYGDLLRLSGIEDLAAAHGYRDWPQFSREQILACRPRWSSRGWVAVMRSVATRFCQQFRHARLLGG
jgi:hypothetical protein